jgi:PilZ domain
MYNGKSVRDEVREAGTATTDRRNADRHTFTASAEVVEHSSGARFSARTTDLGPGGCFVDTILPFPVGAKVRVTVRKGQTDFETDGSVVYSQTGLGMGIAFHPLERYQRQALDNWLVELTGSKQSLERDEVARAAEGSVKRKRPETSAAVARLVRLMISKGILTEAEGASVLHDPVL